MWQINYLETQWYYLCYYKLCFTRKNTLFIERYSAGTVLEGLCSLLMNKKWKSRIGLVIVNQLGDIELSGCCNSQVHLYRFQNRFLVFWGGFCIFSQLSGRLCHLYLTISYHVSLFVQGDFGGPCYVTVYLQFWHGHCDQ